MRGLIAASALMCVFLVSTVEGRKKLADYQTPNTFEEMNRSLSSSKTGLEAPKKATSHHRVMDKQLQFPEGLDQKFYYRMDMTPPVLRVGW
jgi:hypothetical protein